MKLIEDWARKWWRLWSVRFNSLAAMLAAPGMFEPSVILHALAMLPGHTLVALPPAALAVLRTVSAVFFALNLLAVIFRMLAQPRLERRE